MAEAELDISVSVSEALKNVEALRKQFADFAASSEKSANEVAASLKSIEKESQGLGSVLSGLKVAVVGFIGAFIVGAVADFFGEAVAAASESEVALNKLNTALAQTGIYSAKTSSGFEELAKQIQATTAFEDDAVIGAASLIQQLGNLDEQGLQRATKAAVELSARFGIDLESAAQAVGKAANGATGGLQKLGVEFKKGANDAETFANILDDLEKKQGAAELQVNTYAGATANLKNSYGDALEEIGNFIVKNEGVVSAIKIVAKAFNELSKFISENKDTLNELVTSVAKAFIKLVPTIVTSIQVAIDILKTFLDLIDEFALQSSALTLDFKGADAAKKSLADREKSFNEIQDAISGANHAITKFSENAVEGLDKGTKSSNKFFDSINKGSAGARDSLEKIDIGKITDILNSGKAAFQSTEQLAEQVANKLVSLNKAIAENRQKDAEQIAKEYNTLTNQLISGVQKEDQERQKLHEENLKRIKEQQDAQKKAVQEGASNPLGSAFQQTGAQAIEFEADSKLPGLIGQATGLMQTALAGAEGATKLVTSTLGSIADVFLPGIGGAVAAIATELAKGPEHVKQMVSEFFKAVPEILKNIALALPDLVIALAENIGPFIDALVDAIPVIIEKLADKSDEIIVALVKASPKIIRAMAKEIPEAIIKGVAVAIKEAIKEGFADTKANFLDATNEPLANIKNFFANLPNNMAAGFQSLFDKILSIPQLLSEGFLALKQIIFSMRDALLQIPGKLREAASAFVTRVQELPGVILAKLQDGLSVIGAALLEIPGFIIGKLVEGISFVGETLFNAFNVGFAAIGAGFQYIFDGIAAFFVSLGEQFTAFFASFGEQFTQELDNVKAFFAGLGEQFQAAFTSFFTTLQELPNKIFEGLKQAFDKLTGGISSVGDKASAVGGGVSDFVGGFGKAIGLASGGMVPQGFPNDSFPAALTSGELIVPTSTVDKLDSFLSNSQGGGDMGSLMAALNQSSEKNLSINLTIGEKQIADVLLNLNRQGFRVA